AHDKFLELFQHVNPPPVSVIGLVIRIAWRVRLLFNGQAADQLLTGTCGIDPAALLHTGPAGCRAQSLLPESETQPPIRGVLLRSRRELFLGALEVEIEFDLTPELSARELELESLGRAHALFPLLIHQGDGVRRPPLIAAPLQFGPLPLS